MDVLSLRRKRKPSDNWAASDRMFNPLCHILQMCGPYWRATFVASSFSHACCGDNSHFVSSASHLPTGFRDSLILALFSRLSCLMNGGTAYDELHATTYYLKCGSFVTVNRVFVKPCQVFDSFNICLLILPTIAHIPIFSLGITSDHLESTVQVL